MCDETYHGWPNRETWAFHLWVTNEQATAVEARLVVNNAYTSMDGARNAGRFAAEALRVWWHDTLDAARENGYRETLDAMRDDVGSLWRVDWQAVAAAMLDDEPDDTSGCTPPGQQHPSRTGSDATAHGHSECPDGLHTWILVREYRGRDCFSVAALDAQPDGVTVTVDGSADSDEIVEVHSERLVCRDCPAERGDVSSVDYR